MKILFAGGGTGGHFYPLIAVARAIRRVAEDEHIVGIKFYMMSDKILDKDLVKQEELEFIKVPAGKMRRYFSFAYITDGIKTVIGLFSAVWKMYLLMPDVIFSKGGYSSFPAVFAANFLKIPLIIHESDVVPGVANKLAGKWAKRVAVSFAETLPYFEGKNAAITGNPIRSQLVGGNEKEAMETFKLEEKIPVILVLGGSQGAESLNDAILSFLPDALKKYQIIHQTGENKFKDVLGRAGVSLEKNEFKDRYHVHGFLEEGDLRNASNVASLVVSRAGAGLIFEIAAWGLPAILVPLKSAAQDHQRANAYAYARFGGCEVVEETNLTPHLLLAQIDKILGDPEKIKKMKLAAQTFARLDAAKKIAEEIIKLGIHE